MGQSQSTSASGTATPKRRLLITPKKLIRLRRQNANEGASSTKRDDSSAHNQKQRKGGCGSESADDGELYIKINKINS